MILDDHLQHAIAGAKEQFLQSAMVGLFVRKLGRRNFLPTRYQLNRIRRWVQGGCKDSLTFRKGAAGHVALSITSRELRRLVGRARNTLQAAGESAVAASIQRIVPRLHRQFRRNWPSQAKYEEQVTHGFERRLRRRWKRPLDLMEMLVSLARELGGEVNDEARAGCTKRNAPRVETLTRLHARACQIAAEVAMLLGAGYADGASARWRSLHELAVVMIFLGGNGRDLAARYIEHEGIATYRWAMEHEANAERMGYPRIKPEEIAQLKERRSALLKRFGIQFDTEWGWAGLVLRKARPTFRDIENAAALSHWRREYKSASENVHAGPRGALFRLGVGDDDGLVLAGLPISD